jgi:hypothetical protein
MAELHWSARRELERMMFNTKPIPSSMPGILAALTYLRGSARWRQSTPCAETSIAAPGARTYL